MKGSKTVEPIRKLKDVRLIAQHLADRPRDMALFTLGINSNLRASDMVVLTVGQVRAALEDGGVLVREQKTGKRRHLHLNKAVVQALGPVIDGRDDHEPLFTGQRGPLTVPTVSRMVKRWCGHVNLRGNYAAHSLRKTWGYHQRVTFGVDIPTLMVAYNHSTQRQTLDYLCVQEREVRDCFQNVIG